MQLELRRVSPIRAANTLALLYALSMLIFMVPFFVIFSLVPEPTNANLQAPYMFPTFRWLLVAQPVFGLVFGWFSGLIGSYIYNLIATRLGGLQIECVSPDSLRNSPVV
jgi:hypothetical protein